MLSIPMCVPCRALFAHFLFHAMSVNTAATTTTTTAIHVVSCCFGYESLRPCLAPLLMQSNASGAEVVAHLIRDPEVLYFLTGLASAAGTGGNSSCSCPQTSEYIAWATALAAKPGWPQACLCVCVRVWVRACLPACVLECMCECFQRCPSCWPSCQLHVCFCPLLLPLLMPPPSPLKHTHTSTHLFFAAGCSL